MSDEQGQILDAWESGGNAHLPPDPERERALRNRLRDLTQQTRRNRKPKGAAQPKAKLGTKRLKRQAAITSLNEMLDGRAVTARSIYETNSEINTKYDSANALGTVLGQGVNGRGLQLWDDPEGSHIYPPILENGQIIVSELSELDLSDIATERGISVDKLLDQIEALPTLEEWRANSRPHRSRTSSQWDQIETMTEEQIRQQWMNGLEAARRREQEEQDAARLERHINDSNSTRFRSGQPLLMEDKSHPEYGSGEPCSDQAAARAAFREARPGISEARWDAYLVACGVSAAPASVSPPPLPGPSPQPGAQPDEDGIKTQDPHAMTDQPEGVRNE